MNNQLPSRPGFVRATEYLREAQIPTQQPQMQQPTMQARPEAVPPTPPTRGSVPGWVKWTAGIALVTGVGYYFGQHDNPFEHQPQAQGTTEQGNPPANNFVEGTVPGLSEEPSAAASTPATTESTTAALTGQGFKAAPVGCVDIPVNIDATVPITWYSTLDDGTVFKTRAKAYPNRITGAAMISACWNNTRAMAFDQAQSDQAGKAIFDIPSDSVYYTLDERQIENTVQTYPDGAIYDSLRKQFHQRASRYAARRLGHLIRITTDDGKPNTGDIHDIGDNKLRTQLTADSILQAFTTQGQAGIKAALMAQTAEKHFTNIDFAFTGTTPMTSLPFARGLDHQSNRGEQFRYRSKKAKWNIVVGQVISGGTS